MCTNCLIKYFKSKGAMLQFLQIWSDQAAIMISDSPYGNISKDAKFWIPF